MTVLKEAPSPPPNKPSSKVIARPTTHNGMPTVIFKTEDYYGVMIEECKWTLADKFTYGRPKI